MAFVSFPVLFETKHEAIQPNDVFFWHVDRPSCSATGFGIWDILEAISLDPSTDEVKKTYRQASLCKRRSRMS
jgi:hypothetical protein